MPAPKFNVESHVIAGSRVVTITTEAATLAVSAQGLSADANWPHLGNLAVSLASKAIRHARDSRDLRNRT